MYTKFTVVALLLCVALNEVHSGVILGKRLGRSLTACPDPLNPGILVSDNDISGGLFESINLRIPEIGLLETPISCILIVDKKKSSTDPIIGAGGVGSPYVEISIKPGFFESLHYRIEVYRKAPDTTPASTATTL
ncbi:uncharacterized protein LOC114325739 [Diabrotica virgifera virgifera]|uniref:Uncharacterized protein n=1 Tax=Diabrotica virgifera virgifera TaxID=50390 RepID=A0ABM5IC90_DIAVI|nr:uncharacterized protein LOC114325739 [Diabrotica virgifera virgifera]